MKSDLEIAQAAELGLLDDEVELYGKHKAKVSLDVLARLREAPRGEGKTLTTVGLAQALNRIGKRTIATIRQPSMGPTFGIKGGAAGGGYSQVVPMADFNLHLTGDTHAVSMAHNLLAAMLDNHRNHGNSSVLAGQIGLKLADFVVTESGFGSDLGFEKMCDIKCRHSDLRPDAAVVVATVRALKAHSGKYRVVAAGPLDPGLVSEDLGTVEAGMGNLEKHIENVTSVFGLPDATTVDIDERGRVVGLF